jgi:DNA-binding HxlR family transcriptional regulator
MFGEEKNLKDSSKDIIKDTSSVSTQHETGVFIVGSYTKTNKLITALYMVTDIMDKDEPLRNKLRTLGAGIISDMHLAQQNNAGYAMSFMQNKIAELMSFLDIASAINIISEMNFSILRKEFSELNKSILSTQAEKESLNKKIDLVEFFREDDNYVFPSIANNERSLVSPKGHASIGVQKGSTLMKALSGVKLATRPTFGLNFKNTDHSADVFDVLKKQRRDSIIYIIKTIGGGATIKDIKDRVKASPAKAEPLVSCSDKTLQRELVSMVKNGVLDKAGEKRWSRYFIKS